MTTPEAFDERKARQQFVRDRQKIVFTVAIGALAIALVVSFLFYFGVLGKTATTTNAAQPNYGVTAPCPTAADGATAKALNPSTINVRVLNGTDKAGLADAVSESLTNRGFVSKGVSNYPGTATIKRTEIRFGKNTINEAYTLAGHFNDAILRMDDREDKLIDVVIGSTFSDLVDEDKIATKTDADLTAIEGCKAADQMGDLPKAVDHEAVN
ncbi:LytR C-terminal domain-containing protein [Bifidobacterium vansinderenii]|uniref:LytR cell envelope-related transcriptional attenuator n=1 Tax=Bifidobacterium vansinderenii TaxID=1984871 RepID=A0A229VWT8_9BIFI|nr:LytR C-terminal domain-containing protein [Bifidobacterium vansinderenii]OXN00081.1 LytR cell envelope-related transcriptional attenuator [Bifidobacterium vansinderenii]